MPAASPPARITAFEAITTDVADRAAVRTPGTVLPVDGGWPGR